MARQRLGALLIGNELLLGKRQDKHLAHLIETLARRDLVLDFVHMVGDDERAIADLLRQTLAEDAWLVSFGGIGATPDDRTRQAAALAADVPIERHPQAVELIESQFGEAAYPNRIRMAELPAGCELIPNAYNRIPGFTIRHHHFVPGFPQMAWDMIDWLFANRYAHWRGEQMATATVHVLRAKESVLVPLLERLQGGHPGLEVSSLPRMAVDPDDVEFENYVEIGLRGPAQAVDAAHRIMADHLRDMGLPFRELHPDDAVETNAG